MRVNGVGSSDSYVASIYDLTISHPRTQQGTAIQVMGYESFNTKIQVAKLTAHEQQELRNASVHVQSLVELGERNNTAIDMIIGTNVIWPMWNTLEVVRLTSGKQVVTTVIGDFTLPSEQLIDPGASEEPESSDDWIMHMILEESMEALHTDCSPLITENQEERLEIAFERMWLLESLGIRTPEFEDDEKSADADLIRSVRESMVFDGKHISVRLPFNGNQIHLHNNLPPAMKRLSSLVTQLLADPAAMTKYDEII